MKARPQTALDRATAMYRIQRNPEVFAELLARKEKKDIYLVAVNRDERLQVPRYWLEAWTEVCLANRNDPERYDSPMEVFGAEE